MKKEAYYFSHDSNARNDEKILDLRAKYGWHGYGLYWAIVESMREAKSYRLTHDRLPSLAVHLNITYDELNAFVADCVDKFHLFKSNENFYWSESLKSRMKIKDIKKRKLSEAGKIGNATRWRSGGDAKKSQRKGKEKKGKESKGNESTVIPPLPELIPARCNAMGYPEAEGTKFFNYYESNGWKVGKNPMKNWHAALANWCKNIPKQTKAICKTPTEVRHDLIYNRNFEAGRLPANEVKQLELNESQYHDWQLKTLFTQKPELNIYNYPV